MECSDSVNDLHWIKRGFTGFLVNAKPGKFYVAKRVAQTGETDMKNKLGIQAKDILLAIAFFLVIDSLFFHALTFNYNIFNLGFLDPIINH